MKTIISLSIFSIKENIKSRIYLVLTIFSSLIIFIGLLLTGLSGFEQPQRVLVDSGLAIIELFSLLVIVANSSNIVLQDIESKSIYLVLSKPVSRTKYVIGKYLGFLGVGLVSIVVMSTVHLLVIFTYGWKVSVVEYLLVVVGIMLKTGIISAVSLFLIVAMTSQTVAMITSLLIWVGGHFLVEFKFIMDRISSGVIKVLSLVIYYLIPNFQYFNLKDYFGNKYLVPSFSLWAGVLYWFGYVSIVMLLTVWIFKRKNL